MDVYGSGGIVPGREEIEQVGKGVLDITYSDYLWIRDKYPAGGLFTYRVGGMSAIPRFVWFMSEGQALANDMIAGENYIGKFGWPMTPELFLSGVVPIRSLDDIKGLKIRTAGEDGKILTAMGASVVSLPPAEIYESVQRGVIDAYQWNTPAYDRQVHMHEVAKYMYVSPVRQPTALTALIVNKDSWAALPDDLKAIVEAVNQEMAWENLTELVVGDAAAIDFFIDYGVEVGPPPKEVEEEMIKQAEIYYSEQAAADPLYAKILESLRAFGANYQATYPSGL